MQQAESPLTPSGTSIETIKSIVDAVVHSLKEFDGPNEFGKSVSEQLTDQTVLSEFCEWLRGDINVASLAEIKSTSGNVNPSVLRDAAWDALQVVVLAYLPGSRYFQGAYIHSQLHDPKDLKSIKSAFRVPHLSGTVGWMTAHLFAEGVRDPYVVLADAQLDLRGRVAVPDLQLGNRAVLGFPVSLNMKNRELASISGFVFFSHPVPGVFPDDPDTPLGKSFAEIQTQFGSALANAIESYIFRRSGRSVLTQQPPPRFHPRTPLLALSDNDPTGYLVSILFEGDQNRNLAADVKINEGVLLETAASLLRVASTYPDKWAPRFVQHMRHLGNLIEGKRFFERLPMYWFSRGDAAMVKPFYPEQYKNEVEASTSDLVDAAKISSPSVATARRPRGIERALVDIMTLFGARTGAGTQADLVVPIVCEEDSTTHAMGFFRVNCDTSGVRDDRNVKQVFQNLWRVVKELQDELNPDAAQLFLALETKLSAALGHSCQKSPNHTDIRQFKLCIDTVNILSDWLVRQVHRLVLQRISPKIAIVAESEKAQQRELLEQQEKLIRVGLKELACLNESPETSRGADLVKRFDHCAAKFDRLFEQMERTSREAMPEITFVSFWPRMKLPTLKAIDYVRNEPGQSAEETFSELLLADPGLMRMLLVVAPMLKTGKTLSLGPGRLRLTENGSDDLANVDFGVPTNATVTTFEVTRPADVGGLVLDVEWQDPQPHRIRLTWNWEEMLGASRELLGHSISNIPWMIAHRLGENILSGLKLTMTGNVTGLLEDTGFTDGNVLDYVSSTDKANLKLQFDSLERAMLYDDGDAAVWRLLRVPSSSHSFAFLAVLYNKRVKRSSVLAFRDFALANARAFYIAREYDAQRQAADEYTGNLAAISHGYRGPVRQLLLSVSQARTTLYKKTTLTPEVVSIEMRKLEDMVERTKQLASDAIHYARRRTDPKPFAVLDWEMMGAEIKGVVQAFNLPWAPEVDVTESDPSTEVKLRVVEEYWRHLLAKIIDNGITHGDENPDQSSGLKVFINSEVDSRRFVLRITTFLVKESAKSDVERVRRGLIEGLPNSKKASVQGQNENYGFGLMEAHNCCELLGIKREVETQEQGLKLIVSLDGSSMINGRSR